MSRIHAQVDIEFPHFVRMGTTAGDLEIRDSLGGHRQMVAKVFDATVHSGWIVYAWPQPVLSLHLPSIQSATCLIFLIGKLLLRSFISRNLMLLLMHSQSL
jgi:hypothetical protein